MVGWFQLWVHGRQFPESADYNDGNWLRVTAHCGARAASVWVQGPILTTTDIARFGDQCAAMHSGSLEAAALAPLEPDLEISLRVADPLDHIRVQVEITPDHLAQAHRFVFEVDQSYLLSIARQCSTILQEHPVRGQEGQEVG
ncbi:MAG TPA: hypothetical protein PK413_06840 [Thermoanaerobaculia bacterium]|nr:hypothetical protein [Thermoanaerobaculia bacterium]